MTIGHRPAKANQPKLHGRIDKAERGLMSDRTLIVVPITDAARCILRQLALSISTPADLPRAQRPIETVSYAPGVMRQTTQRP